MHPLFRPAIPAWFKIAGFRVTVREIFGQPGAASPSLGGRGCVDANEHREVGLEDLVMGPDADPGEIVTLVDGPRRGDDRVDDLVDRAQREPVVEEVTEQLDDTAKRAVADKDLGQDELAYPVPGDRQIEEDFRVWLSGVKRAPGQATPCRPGGRGTCG